MMVIAERGNDVDRLLTIAVLPRWRNRGRMVNFKLKRDFAASPFTWMVAATLRYGKTTIMILLISRSGRTTHKTRDDLETITGV